MTREESDSLLTKKSVLTLAVNMLLVAAVGAPAPSIGDMTGVEADTPLVAVATNVLKSSGLALCTVE